MYAFSVKVVASGHGSPIGTTVQVVSSSSHRPTNDEIRKAFQQQGLKISDPGTGLECTKLWK
jgi:hypothetical protein